MNQPAQKIPPDGPRKWLRAACFAMLTMAWPALAGFINGGFENGNYTGWTVTHWKNPGTIPTFPPLLQSNLGLTADSTNTWNNNIGYGVVITDVVGPGTDSKISGGVRYPQYGNYAARINYNGNQNRATSIDQTATMLISDVDPSDGKVHIRFSIAPVLENPNHTANQQPYFFIEVTNITKGKQLFTTFNFSGQAGQPWTTVGTYQYTNWQSIDIAPGAGTLDVGDQVKVVIVASGCGPSGHEGHVYVDSGLNATSLPGPYIAATGPASASGTAGTQITYTYNYGNSGAAALTNAVAVIIPPQDNSATRKNLTYVSNTIPGLCTFAASKLTCNLGTLNAGATGTFQVTFSLPSGATSTVNHGDYTLSGDNASAVLGPLVQTVLTGTPLADLQTSITDGVSSATWGDTLTYTAVVTNAGPAAANGATLVETLPAGLTAASWTCSGTGATCPVASGSGSINQSGINLPSGASLTYVITATATGSGNSTISHAINVTAPGSVADPNPANNLSADVDNAGPGLYTLTANKVGSGTVTTIPSGISCGTACPSASATFPIGSSVISYAVAPSGSIFAGWSGGGCSGTGSSCSVTLNSDTTITASFVTPLNVTPVIGANGTVSPSVTQPVAPGGTTTFTVTPNSNYALVPVTDDCGPGGTQTGGTLLGNTWTTNAISQSCNINFSFTNTNVRTVTPSAGANGSVTPATVQTIPTGSTASFTVLPNSGYAAATPTGTCPAGSWSGNIYTTGTVNTNCTVNFTFVAGYTASGLVLSGSGSIGPLSVNVLSGGSATFTIAPGTGFSTNIDASSTCPAGSFSSGTSYTVPNITANCTVVARFDPITYTATGSVLSGSGTISPASQTAGYGGSAVFTITPSAGWTTVIDFSSTCPAGAFAADGVTYTVPNITANCSLVARFNPPPPALAISKVHSGNFVAGSSDAYAITVSNTGGSATSGVVTVTDTAPSGMTVTALSGTGWTCVVPSCTRSDALANGSAYPAITVTVSVASNATTPLVNAASASGGGSATASTTDSTVIVQPAALAITKTHSGSFVAGSSGTYTISVSNNGGIATSGLVTVTDTAPAGMTVSAMSGTGWTCVVPSCTRSDALANGSAYPAITVTVSVASNATTPLLNAASVSGGGSGTANTTDSTVIMQPALLAITKTHAGNFVAGSSGTYTISVSNAGGIATSGLVTVIDTAPAGMTVTAMSGTGWTCVVPSCTRADTLAIATAWPDIAVAVAIAPNATTPLINTASTSGGSSVTASATDSTVIVQPAALAITKAHSGNFVAGGSGIYTLSVANNGGVPTSGTVTVTDTAPAGMTVTAMSGAGWTCAVLPTCNRTDALAASATYPDLTVSVAVASNANTPLVNAASAAGGGSATASTTDSTVIVQPASLAITKSHSGNFVAGSTGAYTITVSNAGGSATSGVVTVTDAAPAGMTVTAMAGSGWSCVVPTCTRSDALANGASWPIITAAVSVASNATTPLVNAASASGGSSATASTTDSTVIVQPPALTITKTHSGNFVAGSGGAYTVTVSNTGGIATSGVVTVTDTAPAGMSVTAMSGTGWTCVVPSCTRTDVLAIGSSYPAITVTVSVASNATTPLLNTASVSGGGSSNANTTDSTVIVQPAALTITKTHSGSFVAGSSGTYTISVSNNGGIATSGLVTVTDTAPAGMTVTAMSGTGWACVVPSCTRSDALANGAAYPTITVTVSVASNAATPLVNAATASGGASATASTTDSTVIVQPPAFAIAKTHSGSFTAGATGAYTVTVSNTGGSPTSGLVTITDTVPAGMTVTAMSGTGWACLVPSCTRSDALANGSAYPAIAVTVSVASSATTPLVNAASASGGGSATANTADSTAIVQPAALAISKIHSGNFVAGSSGTYTVTVSNNGGIATSGLVTVTDTAPAGMTVAAMSGTGWTCVVPSCTRADALAIGSSFPAITVTVSIASNATSPLINAVSATGGGSAPANATDSTTIEAADMRVSLTGWPATTGPGIVVTGAISCTNQGVLPATHATCSVAGGATVSNCKTGATPVTLPLASLPVGSSITCDVAITAPTSGNLNVNASTGAANDSGSVGKQATTVVSVSSAPGTGTISGTVWYDLNRNGLPDVGESGRAGWTIRLLSGNTLVSTAVTGTNGQYTFPNLRPGVYTVQFIDAGGNVLTSGPMPVNGDTSGNGGSPARSELRNIVVGLGTSVVNQSLPIDPSGVVYDSVTRVPLAGVTVTLLYNGAPVNPAWVAGASATQLTDASGQYAFFLLPAAAPGTYGLRAAIVGFTPSPSALIPPTTAPPGFTGGSVGFAGAPPIGQTTTYYLAFQLPVTDITNNNIPLDNVGLTAAMADGIPTLSEWSMIITAGLLLFFGAGRLRGTSTSPLRRAR